VRFGSPQVISTTGATSLQRASGGAWTAWTPTTNTLALDWGRNMAEFQVRFSDLGLTGVTNTLGLYMFVCNGSTLVSAWPPENVQSGTGQTLNVEAVFASNDSSRFPRLFDQHWGDQTVAASTTGLKSLLNGYVTLNVTSGGGGGCTVNARVVANASVGANLIHRVYTLTPTNCTGLVGDLTLKYEDGTDPDNAPSEISGFTEANLKMLRNNGSSWVEQGGAIHTANNTITKNGVSQFSP